MPPTPTRPGGSLLLLHHLCHLLLLILLTNTVQLSVAQYRPRGTLFRQSLVRGSSQQPQYQQSRLSSSRTTGRLSSQRLQQLRQQRYAESVLSSMGKGVRYQPAGTNPTSLLSRVQRHPQQQQQQQQQQQFQIQRQTSVSTQGGRLGVPGTRRLVVGSPYQTLRRRPSTSLSSRFGQKQRYYILPRTSLTARGQQPLTSVQQQQKRVPPTATSRLSILPRASANTRTLSSRQFASSVPTLSVAPVAAATQRTSGLRLPSTSTFQQLPRQRPLQQVRLSRTQASLLLRRQREQIAQQNEHLQQLQALLQQYQQQRQQQPVIQQQQQQQQQQRVQQQTSVNTASSNFAPQIVVNGNENSVVQGNSLQGKTELSTTIANGGQEAGAASENLIFSGQDTGMVVNDVQQKKEQTLSFDNTLQQPSQVVATEVPTIAGIPNKMENSVEKSVNIEIKSPIVQHIQTPTTGDTAVLTGGTPSLTILQTPTTTNTAGEAEVLSNDMANIQVGATQPVYTESLPGSSGYYPQETMPPTAPGSEYEGQTAVLQTPTLVDFPLSSPSLSEVPPTASEVSVEKSVKVEQAGSPSVSVAVPAVSTGTVTGYAPVSMERSVKVEQTGSPSLSVAVPTFSTETITGSAPVSLERSVKVEQTGSPSVSVAVPTVNTDFLSAPTAVSMEKSVTAEQSGVPAVSVALPAVNTAPLSRPTAVSVEKSVNVEQTVPQPALSNVQSGSPNVYVEPVMVATSGVPQSSVEQSVKVEQSASQPVYTSEPSQPQVYDPAVVVVPQESTQPAGDVPQTVVAASAPSEVSIELSVNADKPGLQPAAVEPAASATLVNLPPAPLDAVKESISVNPANVHINSAPLDTALTSETVVKTSANDVALTAGNGADMATEGSPRVGVPVTQAAYPAEVELESQAPGSTLNEHPVLTPVTIPTPTPAQIVPETLASAPNVELLSIMERLTRQLDNLLTKTEPQPQTTPSPPSVNVQVEIDAANVSDTQQPTKQESGSVASPVVNEGPETVVVVTEHTTLPPQTSELHDNAIKAAVDKILSEIRISMGGQAPVFSGSNNSESLSVSSLEQERLVPIHDAHNPAMIPSAHDTPPSHLTNNFLAGFIESPTPSPPPRDGVDTLMNVGPVISKEPLQIETSVSVTGVSPPMTSSASSSSDATDQAGSATAGSATAGSATAGSATAGSETTGSATAGSETTGSATTGSATAGSETSVSATAPQSANAQNADQVSGNSTAPLSDPAEETLKAIANLIKQHPELLNQLVPGSVSELQPAATSGSSSNQASATSADSSQTSSSQSNPSDPHAGQNMSSGSVPGQGNAPFNVQSLVNDTVGTVASGLGGRVQSNPQINFESSNSGSSQPSPKISFELSNSGPSQSNPQLHQGLSSSGLSQQNPQTNHGLSNPVLSQLNTPSFNAIPSPGINASSLASNHLTLANDAGQQQTSNTSAPTQGTTPQFDLVKAMQDPLFAQLMEHHVHTLMAQAGQLQNASSGSSFNLQTAMKDPVFVRLMEDHLHQLMWEGQSLSSAAGSASKENASTAPTQPTTTPAPGVNTTTPSSAQGTQSSFSLTNAMKDPVFVSMMEGYFNRVMAKNEAVTSAPSAVTVPPSPVPPPQPQTPGNGQVPVQFMHTLIQAFSKKSPAPAPPPAKSPVPASPHTDPSLAFFAKTSSVAFPHTNPSLSPLSNNPSNVLTPTNPSPGFSPTNASPISPQNQAMASLPNVPSSLHLPQTQAFFNALKSTFNKNSPPAVKPAIPVVPRYTYEALEEVHALLQSLRLTHTPVLGQIRFLLEVNPPKVNPKQVTLTQVTQQQLTEIGINNTTPVMAKVLGNSLSLLASSYGLTVDQVMKLFKGQPPAAIATPGTTPAQPATPTTKAPTTTKAPAPAAEPTEAPEPGEPGFLAHHFPVNGKITAQHVTMLQEMLGM